MTIHSGKTPDEPTIAEFKTSLRGTLIRPGDNGYDTARNIHNAMIDRRPDFIVRCAGVADVIGAVNFARSHDLLVAIRGTGHNAHVEDPRAAHDVAVKLGARLLQAADLDAREGHQVYADPAGHPFCIGWGHPSRQAVAAFVADRLGGESGGEGEA